MFSGSLKFWLTFGIAFIVTAVFLAAAFFGVIYVKRGSEVLIQSKQDLAELEANRREVIAASNALTGAERERNLIESSFFDPLEPLPFYDSVGGLARRLGVTHELSFAPGSSSARPDKFTVSVGGSFNNALLFLKNLESSPFLLQVSRVEMNNLGAIISQDKKLTPEPRVEIRVSIKTVTP